MFPNLLFVSIVFLFFFLFVPNLKLISSTLYLCIRTDDHVVEEERNYPEVSPPFQGRMVCPWTRVGRGLVSWVSSDWFDVPDTFEKLTEGVSGDWLSQLVCIKARMKLHARNNGLRVARAAAKKGSKESGLVRDNTIFIYSKSIIQ